MNDTAASLIADIPRLTADEQRALRYVVDRILVQGRSTYAPWQAAGDQRNMTKEIGDELADAIVYVGMRAVMRAAPVVASTFTCVDGVVSEVLL